MQIISIEISLKCYKKRAYDMVCFDMRTFQNLIDRIEFDDFVKLLLN